LVVPDGEKQRPVAELKGMNYEKGIENSRKQSPRGEKGGGKKLITPVDKKKIPKRSQLIWVYVRERQSNEGGGVGRSSHEEVSKPSFS